MVSTVETELATRPATPWWFWAISGLALIWNLMGVGAYIMQATATPEDLVAAYGQTQADLMAAQPAWYTAVFALAVFAGALGCLLLLLRKAVAIWPLLLSLICVALQHIYFAMSGTYEFVQGAEWTMVILVPVVAIFLVWFSRNMRARGILK
jgi:uncharacterized membrane protein